MDNTEIVEELKRVSRRLDDLEKSQTRLNSDREIFEDILTSLSAIEYAIHLSRSTQTENAKNTKADIKEVKEAVEAKVEEVNENIENKTVIVKSADKTILQTIIDKVGGK